MCLASCCHDLEPEPQRTPLLTLPPPFLVSSIPAMKSWMKIDAVFCYLLPEERHGRSSIFKQMNWIKGVY